MIYCFYQDLVLGCHGDHALSNGENLNNQGSSLIYYNNIRKKILSKDIFIWKIYKNEHVEFKKNHLKFSLIKKCNLKQIDNLNQTCTWGKENWLDKKAIMESISTWVLKLKVF